MRPVHLTVEPKTPDGKGSDVPYAIQVASPGPYADRDESSIRVAIWGVGLFNCYTHLVPNCSTATLCSCVSLAQITSHISLYRYKTVLCGLFLVAIVQLLLAIVAFAQVHDSASSTNLSEDCFRRKSSWWSLHNRALLSEPRDNNDDNDYDTGSSLAEDAYTMAASPWGRALPAALPRVRLRGLAPTHEDPRAVPDPRLLVRGPAHLAAGPELQCRADGDPCEELQARQVRLWPR